MKWLFIILLIINIVYFGWELDRQTKIIIRNATSPITVSADTEKLVLFSELKKLPQLKKSELIESSEYVESVDGSNLNDLSDTDEMQKTDLYNVDIMIEKEFSDEIVSTLPDISTSRISKVESTKMELCFTYGPFPDEKQANELGAWFKEREILINQRMEKKKIHRLFWIYLASRESRERAIAAMKDLKSKGIKDYRLINAGDLQNSISLGLFSTQAAVNKRLNELKNKGYQPIVVPYHNAKLIHWVDIKLVKQQGLLTDIFTEYPSRFNSVPMSCDEFALL